MSLFFFLPTSGSPLYTVSGESITHSTAGGNATAGLRINSDGTIDKLVNITYTQIDTATDWVIPNAEANGDHDVRITNVVWTTGSSFDTEAAVADTWIDLSADRSWIIQDTNSGPTGTKLVDFDVEIRDPFGVTVASGSFTLNAEYDTS